MIAETAKRVREQTDPEAMGRIDRQTDMRVAYYAMRPEEILGRLQELDREWDVERVLETGSSSLSLLGVVLAIARGRKWILLPLIIQGFFLQHALQGWCPPLVVLRRLGFRTAREIEEERYALKAIRGDFQQLPPTSQSRGTAPVLDAVRR